MNNTYKVQYSVIGLLSMVCPIPQIVSASCGKSQVNFMSVAIRCDYITPV